MFQRQWMGERRQVPVAPSKIVDPPGCKQQLSWRTTMAMKALPGDHVVSVGVGLPSGSSGVVVGSDGARSNSRHRGACRANISWSRRLASRPVSFSATRTVAMIQTATIGSTNDLPVRFGGCVGSSRAGRGVSVTGNARRASPRKKLSIGLVSSFDFRKVNPRGVGFDRSRFFVESEES